MTDHRSRNGRKCRDGDSDLIRILILHLHGDLRVVVVLIRSKLDLIGFVITDRRLYSGVGIVRVRSDRRIVLSERLWLSEGFGMLLLFPLFSSSRRNIGRWRKSTGFGSGGGCVSDVDRFGLRVDG